MVIKDVISSIVVFAFSLTAFILARDFGSGAELFPRGLAIIMMLASAAMLARAVFWPKVVPQGVARMEIPDVWRTGLCVALTIAYVAVIQPLGFATSSFCFVVITSYLLGLRSHLTIWLTAAGFVGILYFLFVRIFHTPLAARGDRRAAFLDP